MDYLTKEQIAERISAGQLPVWSGPIAYYGRIVYTCGHSAGQPAHYDSASRSLCWECCKALVGTEIEFLRRGAPPAHGRSRNHVTGELEAGVSCYLMRDGQVMSTDRFQDRPAYVGRGIVVGFGSDDEPLVNIISIRRCKAMD